jgi:hypothetical protein
MYTFAPHYVFMMMLKPGRVLLFTISLDLQWKMLQNAISCFRDEIYGFVVAVASIHKGLYNGDRVIDCIIWNFAQNFEAEYMMYY